MQCSDSNPCYLLMHYQSQKSYSWPAMKVYGKVIKFCCSAWIEEMHPSLNILLLVSVWENNSVNSLHKLCSQPWRSQPWLSQSEMPFAVHCADFHNYTSSSMPVLISSESCYWHFNDHLCFRDCHTKMKRGNLLLSWHCCCSMSSNLDTHRSVTPVHVLKVICTSIRTRDSVWKG